MSIDFYLSIYFDITSKKPVEEVISGICQIVYADTAEAWTYLR